MPLENDNQGIFDWFLIKKGLSSVDLGNHCSIWNSKKKILLRLWAKEHYWLHVISYSLSYLGEFILLCALDAIVHVGLNGRGFIILIYPWIRDLSTVYWRIWQCNFKVCAVFRPQCFLFFLFLEFVILRFLIFKGFKSL